MIEPKRPLKVFLCHIIPLWDASTDKLAVRELYQRLTKDGMDAWLDKIGCKAGKCKLISLSIVI